MCKIISVISCKGGVGKTTSAVNISAYLKMQGKSVCAVDLDAQHNLSRHFGVWAIPSAETPTITELFRAAIDDCPDETMHQMVRDSICQTTTVDMIPSTVQLSSLEAALSTATRRERVLEYILFLYAGKGCMTASVWPKPVRSFFKMAFVYAFQYHPDNLLQKFVIE